MESIGDSVSESSSSIIWPAPANSLNSIKYDAARFIKCLNPELVRRVNNWFAPIGIVISLHLGLLFVDVGLRYLKM